MPVIGQDSDEAVAVAQAPVIPRKMRAAVKLILATIVYKLCVLITVPDPWNSEI
jgi:hypothetical protein